MNRESFLHHGINTKWIGVSGLLVMYDIVAVNAAYFLALWLRFDCSFSKIPGNYLGAWRSFAPAYTLICLLVFWNLHLYSSVWRFASYSELIHVLSSSAVTMLLHTVLITVLLCRNLKRKL